MRGDLSKDGLQIALRDIQQQMWKRGHPAYFYVDALDQDPQGLIPLLSAPEKGG